jgi:hypothetical protein
MFDMETERRTNNLMLSSLTCYGMEMNVGGGGETKVMIISAEPCTVQIMIDKKQLENVKITTILGNMVTNDAKFTRGISGLSWQEQHSTGRRIFLPANWT